MSLNLVTVLVSSASLLLCLRALLRNSLAVVFFLDFPLLKALDIEGDILLKYM
jgi:hypothetical protein